MPRRISFTSEHTAEYVLVPDLIAKVSNLHSRLVPVYFWATREGNNRAKESMAGYKVKVLTAYPRRPKVRGPSDEFIQVKLNHQLFSAARAAKGFGIPTIAGVPLAPNLQTLLPACPCAWFSLSEVAEHQTDLEFLVRVRDGKVFSDSLGIINDSLADQQIRKQLDENAVVLSWDEAVTAMRTICTKGNSSRGHFFFSGYRPFFLLSLG